MKKIVFTVGCCLLLFMSKITLGQEENSTAKKLSFEDALQITEQNSLIVKQAKQNINQKEEEQKDEEQKEQEGGGEEG